MPEFTSVWFERDVRPLWEKYLGPLGTDNCIFDREPQSYLELGVYEGASMLWVLENLESVKRAYGVDAWQAAKPRNQPQFDAIMKRATDNLMPWINSGRCLLFQELTLDFLTARAAKASQRPFDLIYVDASHVAHETLLDMELSWRLLNVGGLMIVDDMNRVYNVGKAETRIAVWAWQMAYTNRFEVAFQEGRQIAFRRVK